MYICTYIRAVAFQWDPRKADTNAKKHGVRFSDVVSVFEDPRAITIDDPYPAEQRLVTIGLDILDRVVVVCWTTRGDDIRLFSAREATRRERAKYEQGE